MSIETSSPRPDVSVIIPHFNQVNALRACLKSVVAQTYPATKTEIILVDNNSEQDLSFVQREFPSVRFLREINRGAAHARNAGLAVARANKIAFIDADCIADQNWLAAGVEALDQHPLLGGNIVVTAQSDHQLTGVEAFEQIFAFRQEFYIKRKQFTVTANFFARRSVFDTVGLFQNGVAEDFEWCKRAHAIGIPLAFIVNSTVMHPARKNWDELTNKWDRLTIERWNGFKVKSRLKNAYWIMLAMATAISSGPHLAAVMFSNRVTGLKNKIAAAVVLIRIRLWRSHRMLSVSGAL